MDRVLDRVVGHHEPQAKGAGIGAGLAAVHGHGEAAAEGVDVALAQQGIVAEQALGIERELASHREIGDVVNASLDAAAKFVEGEGPGDAAVEAGGARGATSLGTFLLFGGDHGAGGIGHDAGGVRALGHQACRCQRDRTVAGNAGGGGTHQGRHRPLDAVAGAGAHQGTAIAAAQIRGAARESAADGIGANGGAIFGANP